MVDLATSFEGKNHSFEILSPVDDEPIGLTVELCGPDDDNVPALVKVKKDHKAEINGYMKKGKLKVPDGVFERQGREKLAARVVKLTWAKDCSIGGEQPEATVENVLSMFDQLPWFHDQVLSEGMDSGNFFTKSGKS